MGLLKERIFSVEFLMGVFARTESRGSLGSPLGESWRLPFSRVQGISRTSRVLASLIFMFGFVLLKLHLEWVWGVLINAIVLFFWCFNFYVRFRKSRSSLAPGRLRSQALAACLVSGPGARRPPPLWGQPDPRQPGTEEPPPTACRASSLCPGCHFHLPSHSQCRCGSD